jgi:hypothetical protein
MDRGCFITRFRRPEARLLEPRDSGPSVLFVYPSVFLWMDLWVGSFDRLTFDPCGYRGSGKPSRLVGAAGLRVDDPRVWVPRVLRDPVVDFRFCGICG